jgi:putative phosphoribosyl transferase
MFARFKNRQDAAIQLLPLLSKYKDERSVVLALPRGGVPIAYQIAKKYNLPLELLMTKKIGHPINKEFAIGAVSLEDHIIDERFAIPKSYIDVEVETIRQSLRDRYKKFMGDREPVDLKNKTVIIVDDGIATGYTILSAIKMLRKKEPEKIVVAVPVAPPDTAATIKKYVDDFICLYTPEPFIGVGLHYMDFSQVSDDEVVQLLKEANHSETVA